MSCVLQNLQSKCCTKAPNPASGQCLLSLTPIQTFVKPDETTTSLHNKFYSKMNPWVSIPVTLALVYRARTRNSLTTGGIAAAVLTAIAHAIHPWSVFFTLLIVFFLTGTAVTKVIWRFYDRSAVSTNIFEGKA